MVAAVSWPAKLSGGGRETEVVMRRLICLFALWAACPTGSASALTVRDVVELTRAGLGEDTLLTLIEVDPSVFPIDAATLTALKSAGVSERVIVAMIRSGRWPAAGAGSASNAAEIAGDPIESRLPAAPTPARPDPQIVIIDHHDPAPVIREVPVAVPIYIPVERRRRDDDREAGEDTGRARRGTAPAAPVYWGWGGKLRPDAWQPN